MTDYSFFVLKLSIFCSNTYCFQAMPIVESLCVNLRWTFCFQFGSFGCAHLPVIVLFHHCNLPNFISKCTVIGVLVVFNIVINTKSTLLPLLLSSCWLSNGIFVWNEFERIYYTDTSHALTTWESHNTDWMFLN